MNHMFITMHCTDVSWHPNTPQWNPAPSDSRLPVDLRGFSTRGAWRDLQIVNLQ